MTNREKRLSAQTDPAIGLLANVPKALLDDIAYTFNLDEENNRVELIILYRDTAEKIRELINSLDGSFEDLGFNFGIVNIPIDRLRELAISEGIQYIELPKNLYEADADSNRASCIPEARNTYEVSGKNILVGFIDSGIDYMHPAFMNDEGTTRIEYIYDLSAGGKVYNKQTINEAIKSPNPFLIVPSSDITGHGTHVVGIACAGGRINPRYKGVAPDSSIAMVKAARGVAVLSSQIMRGLKFLLDKSKELNMPLCVNISLSTNNGPHNGSSLLEQYIRTIANLERICIVIAAGNEGAAAHHTSGQFIKNPKRSFNVASDERVVVINFYKTILSNIALNIIGPTGQRSNTIEIREGYFQGNIGRNRFDIYVAGPKPFELDSEIQIILSARSGYLVEGIWTLEIELKNEYDGEYSIWLPVSEGLNPNTRFMEPITLNTLGIPATVDNIIAVGSYDYINNKISPFSGRGALNRGDTIRPDVVAPGENIMAPVPNESYDSKTGTSMATPQVCGICALIMEWGIIKGNDPYLFGQRLKYYLVKSAKRDRKDIEYPNPMWGYGKVCAFDTFYLIEETLSAILSRGTLKESINRKIKENIYSNEFYIGKLFFRIPKSQSRNNHINYK